MTGTFKGNEPDPSIEDALTAALYMFEDMKRMISRGTRSMEGEAGYEREFDLFEKYRDRIREVSHIVKKYKEEEKEKKKAERKPELKEWQREIMENDKRAEMIR